MQSVNLYTSEKASKRHSPKSNLKTLLFFNKKKLYYFIISFIYIFFKHIRGSFGNQTFVGANSNLWRCKQ